ncbi:MAG: SPL family radical SAM protein [Planctomycetota bacterium]|jgi:spore photoproduct lyase
MDIAKKLSPAAILLWRNVAEHPEAQRILSLFPSAKVHLIKHQLNPPLPNIPQGQALLRGKRTLMIGKTWSFVGHFDGQPVGFSFHRTRHNKSCPSVNCRPYYKLVPVSNGCPYYCTYCYLAYVYRKFRPFIKININYDTMFEQVRETLVGSRGPVSFNMGEMLDSLALDHITNLTKMLIPFFSDFSHGFLMLLTKSSNIDNLLATEPNSQTVVSWSLNSHYAIETFEPGTASLDERLQAAQQCQARGYRIRFRIDPGILHPDWQAGYAELIQKALAATQPENVTLGMLRLLPGHFRLAKDAYGNRGRKLCDHNFVRGASDGKLRYPPQQRVEHYTFLIDVIRSFDKNVSISLCRETADIWSALSNRCEPAKCNCVTW